jgi:hypothetical protein
MPNPMEKATAYLCKLKADRVAAMELSKKKELEAMFIKAREEGFREAMEIFGLNRTAAITPNDSEVENHKLRKRKRRDIRQMIIQEMSYSAKAMTTWQISKVIDYLQDRTESVLKRLENEGKIAQDRDGHWEIIAITGAPRDSLTVAA